MIQLSDRRLSTGGLPVDEKSNKATVFICANGRFAVGYTGISRVGAFSTQPWLVEALGEAGPPDFGVFESATRLARLLTDKFKTDRDLRRLPPQDRRLTVMLSGFLYNKPGGEAGSLLISNFQDFYSGRDLPLAQPDFTLYAEKEKAATEEPLTYVQRVGAWQAMTGTDVENLRSLLARDAPLPVIIDAGVGTIRSIADRPRAQGTVGKEILVSVIPRASNMPVEGFVRSPNASDELVFADEVVSLPDHQHMLRDFRITAVDKEDVRDPQGFRPKLSRNERCWCGSGLKHKRCHGK